MMNNKIDLIELKHNIDMLRIQQRAFADTINVYEQTDYGKGVMYANKQYDKYINRLEKLMEGVNIYE